MKNIDNLVIDILKLPGVIEQKLVDKQRDTAFKIQSDVIKNAPTKSGRYVSTIKVSDTVVKNNIITTKIYTDLLVGGSNPRWSNIPLGCLLEWGTGIKGANTNTYPHGYSYRLTPWCYYDEELGQWITTTGMKARPHFKPALERNKDYYKSKIGEAFKE